MSDEYIRMQHQQELSAHREMIERFRVRLKDPARAVPKDYDLSRIDSFLHRATAELDNAERIIPLLGEREKAWRLNFRASIQAARNFMVMAEEDAGIVRDRIKMAGTRKKKFQECDDWIDKQLRRNPGAKSPEVYNRAPEWITDRIGPDRFAKRMTEGRKRAKAAASN